MITIFYYLEARATEFLQRGIVSANFGIQDTHKLTSGVFERLDNIELALQKRLQDGDPEGFDCDVFPLTTMLEFEEVNEQLKQIHARKSLVNTLKYIVQILALNLCLGFPDRKTDSHWRKKFWQSCQENSEKGDR